MTTLYPLQFEPVFKHYIWGGRNLERFGRALPDERDVAESWEISAHPNGLSRVAEGPLAGKTLPELLDVFGTALVGERSAAAVSAGIFPLLVKVLDCNRPLSVQVHPTAAYASAQGGSTAPKTEMWYVVDAQPGAQIVYGVTAGTTRETFAAALADGTLRERLHFLPVQAGDAIFVPSGSLHALLEGLVVVEIQQSSDTTYRVYDWDRVDKDGKPRELHVDHALNVIDYGQVAPGPYVPEPVSGRPACAVISRSPYFVVEKYALQAGDVVAHSLDGASFDIIVSVAGRHRLVWGGGALWLDGLSSLLLPATLGDYRLETTQAGDLLRSYVPAA